MIRIEKKLRVKQIDTKPAILRGQLAGIIERGFGIRLRFRSLVILRFQEDT